MLVRMHRWSKRLLIAAAALPICQAATCDPGSLANVAAQAALGVAAQINVAIFQLFISSTQQTLLRNFPSADILQILLGANRYPFFFL